MDTIREPRVRVRNGGRSSRVQRRWEGALVDLADSAGGGECTVGEVCTRGLDRAIRSECGGGML